MLPAERLDQITQRFQFLEAAMTDGSGDVVALSKEYSDLRPVVEQITAYRGILADIAGAEDLLKDPDMKGLAEDELEKLARPPHRSRAIAAIVAVAER